MRTSIRTRLFISYLIVLVVGMGLAGVLSWVAVERLYLDTQRENMLAQARLMASTLQGMPLPLEPVDAYLQTSNVAPGVHTRLLDEQGAVLVGLPLTSGDAPVQAPLAENSGFVPPEELLQRPEIQSALSGQAATAVRSVPSADDRRVLYAAAPVWMDQAITGIAYLATPLPPARLPTQLVVQLLGAIFVAVLLAGVAGRMLSGDITRRLQRLDRAATAVSGGDLTQHVPINSKIRELDNLGLAFNTMTASLRQTEQAKNAFIADVTHELRTPLTVIKGTVETLEDGALDDLQGRDSLLASMHQETDRLIRLVNDLLILTRADAGKLDLDIRPLDLEKLARTRCLYLNSLAEDKGVKLEILLDHIEPRENYIALGDADRLAQVYDNLLNNAIRHAHPDTRITLTFQKSGNEIKSAVQDQGAGISAEHLPYIFERFYRSSTSRDRQTGGSGLGLSIVRSLVHAHGGRIDAESVVGKGTLITFWLPAAKTDTELPHF
jgi:signal transduction histidine kinase